jgi:hypothetical protein
VNCNFAITRDGPYEARAGRAHGAPAEGVTPFAAVASRGGAVMAGTRREQGFGNSGADLGNGLLGDRSARGRKRLILLAWRGAAYRIRTCDPLITNQVLYRLS